ncbi:DUF5685 family protein [Herbidospora mongoliensis]|uniref:DUF5685 family protein n=1 Tax=Herbidospora mongoliensis TaxID=688067 RepID=UPI0008310B3D|nr:DUF5685 family protein [Herbidospora mongoliensis]
MFGIVRPCQHNLCGGLFAEWMAHLCGLCVALRDEHGQAARLVTNYDGLLVSVLTEAQSPVVRHRRAAPCALRGFKGADISEAEGVRLAAAVSLILASGKLKDHIEDGDGVFRRRLVAAGAGRLADRWSAAGTGTAADLAFDPAPLVVAVQKQALLERLPGMSPLQLTGPTEDAVAAAFGHTAVLAGKAHNRATLEEAGRYFGRLAHLLDAVEDLEEDRALGAYNPLVASGTDLATARRHCDEAVSGLGLAVADLDLERRGLVKALLVKETGRAVERTFAEASKKDPRVKPNPGGLISLVCSAAACCTCGLYRPPWDEERYKSCADRCGCNCNCDCGGCDGCSGCCDCCDCCSCDC